MYKKILLPVFLICMSLTMGIATVNAFKMFNEFGDPPEPAVFMKGNWNHIMDPHGCVLLNRHQELVIKIHITLAVNDLSPFTPIHYTTQFYGDPQSELKGPINEDELIPEYLPSGELVYTYIEKIYSNEFYNECTNNPNDPISFDYNLTLKDPNGNLYPIEDNYLLLIPHALLDEDENGDLIAPSIVYSGNNNLCCYGSTSGEEEVGGLFQNTTTVSMAQEDRKATAGLNENATDSYPEIQVLENHNRFNGQQQSTIYPNPFKDVLTVEFPSSPNEETTIQLWDIHGKLVGHQEHSPDGSSMQKATINTSELGAGFYYCSLKSNSYTHTFKVLKSNR